MENQAINGLKSQATAAATETLTVNSIPKYQWTGTNASQIVQMPDVTTLSLGWVHGEANDSTQSIPFKTSDGTTTIAMLLAGQRINLECVLLTGTTAASWAYEIKSGNTTMLGSFTTAQFNTALSDADVATGGGTATGNNTGDQTNITGNAATVTTNANLTGHVTSTGNAAVLGSFTTAQLNAALNDNDVATLAGVETLTNKRITYRVKSEASAASPTFSTDSYDVYEASAQTAAIDFANANITGTPTNGQILVLIVASSTTAARAITYGTNFVSSTIILPTTTTATTVPVTITLQYHSNYAGGAKWVCKGVA